MKEEFRALIKDALARHASLDEFLDILRKQRDAGLAQQSAYDALEELRAEADEQTEDRVLEIMDIVSGFCAPHLRIWNG